MHTERSTDKIRNVVLRRLAEQGLDPDPDPSAEVVAELAHLLADPVEGRLSLLSARARSSRRKHAAQPRGGAASPHENGAAPIQAAPAVTAAKRDLPKATGAIADRRAKT
jgi:hypothetical protein